MHYPCPPGAASSAPTLTTVHCSLPTAYCLLPTRRPGAPLVVTFSNRCFPTKAVAIWQALDDQGHVHLVRRYFEAAGGWTNIAVLDRGPGRGDPLYAVTGRRAGTTLA